MKPLTGKVALVTGASRGLGRSIALAFGDAGADVVVSDLLIEDEEPDKETLAEYSLLAGHFAGTKSVQTRSTSEEIKKKGSRSLAVKMDVTRPEEIEKVVAQVEETLGGVDILVNNAGIMENFALLENQKTELWERDLDQLKAHGMNVIKIWAQWRWSQPESGWCLPPGRSSTRSTI